MNVLVVDVKSTSSCNAGDLDLRDHRARLTRGVWSISAQTHGAKSDVASPFRSTSLENAGSRLGGCTHLRRTPRRRVGSAQRHRIRASHYRGADHSSGLQNASGSLRSCRRLPSFGVRNRLVPFGIRGIGTLRSLRRVAVILVWTFIRHTAIAMPVRSFLGFLDLGFAHCRLLHQYCVNCNIPQNLSGERRRRERLEGRQGSGSSS